MADFIHPKELAKRFPILAKKSFGQNFLVHGPILNTISQKILEHHPSTILEIGPGPASLSQHLVPHVEKLILVEKDVQFKELLETVLNAESGSCPSSPPISASPELRAAGGNLDKPKPLRRVENSLEFAESISPTRVTRSPVEIHFGDFLFCDLEKILKDKPQPIFAAGNLPYNVSVPIFEKLLLHKHLFSRFYLMFQKEVAERICAKPNTKAYGSLSLFSQMLADCKIILPIPPSAFDPRPKIQSAVVEVIPLKTMRFEVDLDFFQQVIQAAFQTRRKTLLNCLSGKFKRDKNEIEKLLQSININPQRRAETLSLEEFAKLTQSLFKG